MIKFITFLCLGIMVVALLTGVIFLTPVKFILRGAVTGEPFANGLPMDYWLDALSQENRKEKAEEALAKIGAPAVEPLLDLLEDPDARFAASDALVRIGPAAVPRLLAALKEGRVLRRQWAGIIMGKMGPEVVSQLIPLLNDDDDEVRFTVATALAEQGPKAKDAVPALIETLKNPKDDLANAPLPIAARSRRGSPPANRSVRATCAEALGKIGPDAKAAVPVLQEALKDRNASVKKEAITALGRIGPESRPAVPMLILFAGGPDSELAQLGVSALGTIGPVDKDVVPALCRALKSGNISVRRVAVKALGKVSSAPEAVAALKEALQDKDAIVRSAAAKELKKIAE